MRLVLNQIKAYLHHLCNIIALAETTTEALIFRDPDQFFMRITGPPNLDINRLLVRFEVLQQEPGEQGLCDRYI